MAFRARGWRSPPPPPLLLLLLWVTGQAAPVAGLGLDTELQIERRFVPDECPRTVRSGDFVRYHYVGTFSDGQKFDSSYDRDSTFNVFVGKGQLIAGMDQALVGMCVNERRFVKIPPKLAYGSEGVSGVIPPDSVLHFDVLLMDIWNSEDQVQVHTYFTPPSCPRTIQVSDFVRYHYNGTFLDGTLFDSSYSRNRTFDTYIGQGYVIAGMDEGLLGVCIGEKRRIVVPPHLGYGEEGRGECWLLPSNSVLHFDVLLMDIWNSEDQVQVHTYFTPPSCPRTIQVSDFVRYHYNGTFLDGTLFDSRWNLGKTYNIVLGSGQVVLGMDMGLREMCVGEKRTVVIPPHLGYGEAGVDGEVPGSAVLVFDIELLELVAGLPEGYMFIWNGEVSPNLFEEIDKDGNGEVLLEEFSEYIHAQVASGKGKLAPGFDAEVIVKNMFTNQDRNGDGKVTAEEFKLKDQEAKHDEL
ncbi:peptidyl-prolyl cis-trans isomerase FKBP9 [Leptonychotes weddellii]|uniref:peptidylprolyl isomerase n=1 Tax=Leptonychotes weddellii TaxID=9713 RepID=A0A2U3XC66_LEPWE|nr:peptidyl-prolyl cis-trans isomerase FKBP9 [Leptonychotes weddellii]